MAVVQKINLNKRNRLLAHSPFSRSPARGIFERKGIQIKTEGLCCCRHDRLGSLQGKCAANADGVQALSNAG
jgi:hypothetical protein